MKKTGPQNFRGSEKNIEKRMNEHASWLLELEIRMQALEKGPPRVKWPKPKTGGVREDGGR